jgi:hypothetical protein
LLPAGQAPVPFAADHPEYQWGTGAA